MEIDPASAALLIIDVQNDFCPGGSLAVKHGDEVIEPLNRLAAAFARGSGKVIATQDWHPRKHISFASSHTEPQTLNSKDQVLWPDHCVRETAGADFHKDLDMANVQLILRKGYRIELDSYSAFFENDRKTSTGLDGFLKGLGIKNIVMGGLATDYCVFYSAMDAVQQGFTVIIAEDAVRGVDIPAGSVEKAFSILRKSGVQFINSMEITLKKFGE